MAGPRPRVLVADDDPALRDLVAQALEDDGFAVRRARDGVEALAAAERDPPDLVISDVQMPRLDGLELAARLAARGVPVLLLSAVVHPAPRRGLAWLAKPFDLDELLAVVRRALARSGE